MEKYTHRGIKQYFCGDALNKHRICTIEYPYRNFPKRIYRLTALVGRLEIEKEETNGRTDHLPLEMEI